jgi:streptomycin 6-kinase
MPLNEAVSILQSAGEYSHSKSSFMISPHDHLALRTRQWDVAIDQLRETSFSLLGFGFHKGAPVVLKISKQAGDEWHAGEVLRAFDGNGTVRVYEYEPGAVLLERLNPGDELVEVVRSGNDEAATEILAQVMKQMSHHEPPSNCSTLLDWYQGFERYLKTDDRQIDRTLVLRAAELYGRLATSQSKTMLLHADLHHYNVLFDSHLGWLAIDPKGVVGELEYEVGAILRNPRELPDLFSSAHVLHRRLDSLTTALGLDLKRTVAWSFAQAVLSAVWDVEDDIPVGSHNVSLRLAHALEPHVSFDDWQHDT